VSPPSGEGAVLSSENFWNFFVGNAHFGAFHTFLFLKFRCLSHSQYFWSTTVKALYTLSNHDLQLILHRERSHLYSSHLTVNGDCGIVALTRHVKLSKKFANRAQNLAGLLCGQGPGGRRRWRRLVNSVVCVIPRLAVLVQYSRVMDRQTDGRKHNESIYHASIVSRSINSYKSMGKTLY